MPFHKVISLAVIIILINRIHVNPGLHCFAIINFSVCNYDSISE
ncbi:hypothetical protein HMPREF0201_00385 [Cedecea davisae DSM 4568]|uniref:Uncharacterized protein n=1 Tax=Cedecea davisae DSM 4568 TaxID=566551 RepID=S3K6G6_9ENTR|nr:hypothetical protein HMPREF0201_00385 [Cedecea davisae DSM 4568]